MIPKKIHYCWFGNNEKNELMKSCIESWKKMCPDYEIIEWNETNYDIRKNKYMSEAYNERKWAFVSDYARLDIIYNHGGFYLDTDVELLKSLDSLIENKFYMGIDDILVENEGQYWVSTGLGFGAEKKNELLKECLDLYKDRRFIRSNNSLDLTPCPMITTRWIKTKGYKDEDIFQYIEGLKIFPSEYFSPKKFLTGEINITDNTISIHHYSNSWNKSDTTLYQKIINKIKSIFS